MFNQNMVKLKNTEEARNFEGKLNVLDLSNMKCLNLYNMEDKLYIKDKIIIMFNMIGHLNMESK